MCRISCITFVPCVCLLFSFGHGSIKVNALNTGESLVACVSLLLICAKPANLQAPLLAYNHFVEALFVLNDCRAGLHGGGSAALISDTDMADATEGNLAQLKGSAPSARAKREAIYRSADTC